MSYREIMQTGDVRLSEIGDSRGPAFVVTDDDHYRIRFQPDVEGGCMWVAIDAEWSDDHPGQLAAYTRDSEGAYELCRPGDVTIGDSGLLSVLAPQKGAGHVDIRIGWTAQLPVVFVAPIRRAIELAEAVLRASPKLEAL